MDKHLVIITGASSGFGLATAKLFSEQDYPLLLVSRNIEPITALNLPNTMVRSVDITDATAFSKAYEEAREAYGPVDLLINNAGVMLLGEIAEQDSSEWATMFNVNVLGLLNGIKLVIEEMKHRKTGTIMNISSIAGRKTFKNHTAYVGTKFAVHGLSENLREELSPHNVRVITIAPGAAETNLLSHTKSAQIRKDYENWKNSMGGVMSAEDVAQAMWFAYKQPQNVCIREIVMAATRQEP